MPKPYKSSACDWNSAIELGICIHARRLFFCFFKILVYLTYNRAILANIHKRESAKFGYRQNLRTLLYFLRPTGTYCLKHMVISKMFFLKKCGNFGAFFSQKNPFVWVALDLLSWFFFLSQNILSHELHWIFSLDFSSCQMVEITVPMIAIHTIVIEKKEEYLRFHLWHSNYVQ